MYISKKMDKTCTLYLPIYIKFEKIQNYYMLIEIKNNIISGWGWKFRNNRELSQRYFLRLCNIFSNFSIIQYN